MENEEVVVEHQASQKIGGKIANFIRSINDKKCRQSKRQVKT